MIALLLRHFKNDHKIKKNCSNVTIENISDVKNYYSITILNCCTIKKNKIFMYCIL